MRLVRNSCRQRMMSGDIGLDISRADAPCRAVPSSATKMGLGYQNQPHVQDRWSVYVCSMQQLTSAFFARLGRRRN